MTSTLMPVERLELVTPDPDEIADLVNRLYVEHTARFRRDGPVQIDSGLRAASAGPLNASLMHWTSFDYDADCSPTGELVGTLCHAGTATATTAGEDVRFGPGDGFMPPPERPYRVNMRQNMLTLVRVPRSIAGELAEQHTGLPAAKLRFEAMAPVSGSAQAFWSRTMTLICRQLIGSGATRLTPLMAQEMTRIGAAALLETFPNTAMIHDTGGPGRFPPAAARRAAEFIEACADQPLTAADIAAQAGVTLRALQYAFRRHYGTTPTGYLRRVRLERAHTELREADPASGLTVAEVARKWGWLSASHFTAVYRRQYGQLPSRALQG
ncbi:MAG TPA: helix-turn-helix transcriptional regulator [Streptosporangiaceae bacterium]